MGRNNQLYSGVRPTPEQLFTRDRLEVLLVYSSGEKDQYMEATEVKTKTNRMVIAGIIRGTLQVTRPDGFTVFLDGDRDLDRIRMHAKDPRHVILAVAVRRAQQIAANYAAKHAPALLNEIRSITQCSLSRVIEVKSGDSSFGRKLIPDKVEGRGRRRSTSGDPHTQGWAQTIHGNRNPLHTALRQMAGRGKNKSGKSGGSLGK